MTTLTRAGRRMTALFAALLTLALTSACALQLQPGPTGQTRNDPVAAQTFLPTIAGYTATSSDSMQDALSRVASEGASIFGNRIVEEAINQVDRFISCYQNVGAVAAQVYTSNTSAQAILGGNVPGMGAVAVVNQDRVRDNFANCALGGRTDGFAAQSAGVELCTGTNTFTTGGNRITYVFVGTQQGFCNAVRGHFARYGG